MTDHPSRNNVFVFGWTFVASHNGKQKNIHVKASNEEEAGMLAWQRAREAFGDVEFVMWQPGEIPCD